MTNYSEYLNGCKIERYSDKYIKYDELISLLSLAQDRAIHGGDQFYRKN